jgi:hypothetical protein
MVIPAPESLKISSCHAIGDAAILLRPSLKSGANIKDATIAACSTSESQKRQASGLRTLSSASSHYFLSGGCCGCTFFEPKRPFRRPYSLSDTGASDTFVTEFVKGQCRDRIPIARAFGGSRDAFPTRQFLLRNIRLLNDERARRGVCGNNTVWGSRCSDCDRRGQGRQSLWQNCIGSRAARRSTR